MSSSGWIHEFKVRHVGEVVPYYESREDRNRWASSIIREFPGRQILNLGGGGKRHLEKHLGQEWTVHEIDVTGDCDTILNLDQVDCLPFADNSFDTCCAFEVLEHLEQFHLVVTEMLRVSRTTILLSLPNAAVEAVLFLRNQRPQGAASAHGVYSKFYGLPLDPPQDRHRWWLSFEDIIRYFVEFEAGRNCRLEFYIPKLDPTISRKILRAIVGERVFLNFFCNNVWIKIDKLSE